MVTTHHQSIDFSLTGSAVSVPVFSFRFGFGYLTKFSVRFRFGSGYPDPKPEKKSGPGSGIFAQNLGMNYKQKSKNTCVLHLIVIIIDCHARRTVITMHTML